MATTDKNTIKNWFKTGLKPTQAQFWAWLDSYWHKNDEIPIGSVKDLSTILNAKAESAQLQAKLDKHIVFGEFAHFKGDGNFADEIQEGDVCAGWINENTFMPFGKYIGGEVTDVNSWSGNPIEF